MPPSPPLELAYDHLSRLLLEGKSDPPTYCEVDGVSTVQLRFVRAPSLTGTLHVAFSDDRIKIWSEIQMESGVHPEVCQLTQDLIAAKMLLSRALHAVLRPL